MTLATIFKIRPAHKNKKAWSKPAHLTTQVWVLRSQSLTWPSANAAKTHGTSPNLGPL